MGLSYKDFMKRGTKNPRKDFKNFEDFRRVAISGTKPSARNSYTEQKIINRWLMDDSEYKGKKKKKDKDKGGSSKSNWSWDKASSKGSSGGGGGGKGGDGGKGGGGKRTTGVEDKGLTDYGEFGSMTPAAFDLYKDIKLRNIDGKNARKLQGIINSGKTDVALIQRDASIYGSLVSGFW